MTGLRLRLVLRTNVAVPTPPVGSGGKPRPIKIGGQITQIMAKAESPKYRFGPKDTPITGANIAKNTLIMLKKNAAGGD
jgi:hypothetical protein